MMAAAWLRRCADDAATACEMLADAGPEAMARCSTLLADTARLSANLIPALESAAGDAAVLTEAWRLRSAVLSARLLLERAAAYHRGWEAHLAVMSAGYEPGGRPGRCPRQGRVSLRA